MSPSSSRAGHRHDMRHDNCTRRAYVDCRVSMSQNARSPPPPYHTPRSLTNTKATRSATCADSSRARSSSSRADARPPDSYSNPSANALAEPLGSRHGSRPFGQRQRPTRTAMPDPRSQIAVIVLGADPVLLRSSSRGSDQVSEPRALPGTAVDLVLVDDLPRLAGRVASLPAARERGGQREWLGPLPGRAKNRVGVVDLAALGVA